MFRPILKFFEQDGWEEPSCRPKLQVSLKEFVTQFGFEGGGIFRLCSGQAHLYPVSYWAKSSQIEAWQQQIAEINWQQVFAAPLQEPVAVELDSVSHSQSLYSCVYSRTSAQQECVVVWTQHPLSELQRYGVILYTQGLDQQPYLQLESGCNQNQSLQYLRHQLGTPLSLIELYVDLLKMKLEDSQSQEWLGNLQTTVAEMRTSLHRLTAGKQEPDHPANLWELRQLWEQCLQEFQPWLEQKQLTLVCNLQASWVQTDRWKLKQVVQNLLSNAIAFSPIGGQITLESQTFQTEVLLKLSDQGPGLSAEDLRSLGKPFYSRRPGGTGMGLAIAMQIILEAQGSLWAENLPEGGAQFCIALPHLSRT